MIGRPGADRADLATRRLQGGTGIPVEFIGMIATRASSETRSADGPLVDVPFTRAFARVHEESGFDRALIGYYSDAPDGFVVAGDVFAHTERLGVLLAHRPGFVAPTVAARKLATLDQFSGGRLALHVISGGSDADQRRDGDYLDHDTRYRRTDEYLEVLRAIWTGEGLIDHAGEFYRFEGASTAVRTTQQPHLPIYFGGSSDAAIAVAARHADVYALWGEPLEPCRAHIERVRAAAAANGRALRFSLSLRAILGDTEDAAWERAHALLEQARARVAGGSASYARSESVGSRRLLEAAAAGEVHDERLFTAIAEATGARGNTTALVGTAEQVAASLLRYVDIGVTTILLRGFDPPEDARDYATVVRLVRAEVDRRDQLAAIER
jgi:alkanesulfonate monooxygenase